MHCSGEVRPSEGERLAGQNKPADDLDAVEKELVEDLALTYVVSLSSTISICDGVSTEVEDSRGRAPR